MDKLLKVVVLAATASVGGGCATITNDPTVPVSFETLKNCKTEMRCEASTKRGTYVFEPPQTIQVRRSDDAMQIRCTAKGTEEVLRQTIESDYEGGKMAASVFLLDLGITDSITDMHRTYPRNVTLSGCIGEN